MKMYAFSALTVDGMPLQAPESGPCRFIPVFETREQAVAYDGSADYVTQLRLGKFNE